MVGPPPTTPGGKAVAPPTKKQRGGATPEGNKLAENADKAIAARKAELERMKNSYINRPNLVPQATSSTGAIVPSIPPPQHTMQLRTSDIFPSAPKSPATSADSKGNSNTFATMAQTAASLRTAPAMPRRLNDKFEAPSTTALSSSSQKPERPSSAPPRRPPPPGSGIPSAPSSGNAPGPQSQVGASASRNYKERPRSVTPLPTKEADPAPETTQPSHQAKAQTSGRLAAPTATQQGGGGLPVIATKIPPPSPSKVQSGHSASTDATSASPSRAASVSTETSKPTASAAASGPPPQVSFFHPNAAAPASTKTAPHQPENEETKQEQKKTTLFALSPVKTEPSTPQPVSTPPKLGPEEPESTTTQPTKVFAGSTPYPKKMGGAVATAAAGATPYPPKNKIDSTAGATPFVKAYGTPDDEEPSLAADTPPSTARRDQFQNMLDAVDSPAPKQQSGQRQQQQHEPQQSMPPEQKTATFAGAPAPLQQQQEQQSAELRIQKELAQAQKEKAEALQALARSEKVVEQLKRKMAADAETSVRNVGFLSPLAPASLPMTPASLSPLAAIRGTPRRGRVPTPHPKKRFGGSSDNEEEDNEVDDEDFLPFLREATNLVPYDYEDQSATFFVRRPYGVETLQEMWFECGQVGAKVYAHQATVYRNETLEVVALIPADGSKLVLHGEDSARHGNREGAWQDFDSVNNQPLGSVTYIDSEANEQVYSLDDIYQSCLQVREMYCGSILTMAVGFQQKKAEEPPLGPEPLLQQEQQQGPSPMMQPPPAATVFVEKPSMADAAVDTQDLPQLPALKPQPPPKQVPSPPPKQVPSPPPQQPQKPTPAPQPEDDNLMGVFMGMIVSLIYTLAIQLPLRILTMVFTLLVSVAIVALVWMYLADDHVVLGGPTPTAALFNPPGIV